MFTEAMAACHRADYRMAANWGGGGGGGGVVGGNSNLSISELHHPSCATSVAVSPPSRGRTSESVLKQEQ